MFGPHGRTMTKQIEGENGVEEKQERRGRRSEEDFLPSLDGKEGGREGGKRRSGGVAMAIDRLRLSRNAGIVT